MTRNLRCVRRVVESRALLLVALSFMPGPDVGAQAPCFAVVRSVSNQSARARLRVVTSARRFDDVTRDGAGCGDSTSLALRVRLPFLRHGVRIAPQLPELRVASLGGLADARGDGPMWSGRGTSLWTSAGLSLDAGILHGVLSPAIWWAENRTYDVYPARDGSRSSFASPWYSGAVSADLPSRFGLDSFTAFDLGESAAWARWRNLDAGFATSTQSLGPGARNHLLLGGDTPGIPRFFARSANPIQTRIGTVSASGFVGSLQESRFFDTDQDNNGRLLWVWSANYAPSEASTFTFGLNQGFLTDGAVSAMDHIITFSLSARSHNQGRAYIEAGRAQWPEALRTFLTAPSNGLVYVIGFEQLSRLSRGDLLFTAEAANVEQQSTTEADVLGDFYTSSNIGQGWSQRGRPLGVATGPGSQSQWLALDWVARAWSAGLFAERVRWNEDALLREPLAFPNRHDVSLRMGLKAGYILGNYEAALQLSTGKRLNYLFQNGSYIPGFRTVDVSIPQLRMSLVPINR